MVVVPVCKFISAILPDRSSDGIIFTWKNTSKIKTLCIKHFVVFVVNQKVLKKKKSLQVFFKKVGKYALTVLI